MAKQLQSDEMVMRILWTILISVLLLLIVGLIYWARASGNSFAADTECRVYLETIAGISKAKIAEGMSPDECLKYINSSNLTIVYDCADALAIHFNPDISLWLKYDFESGSDDILLMAIRPPDGADYRVTVVRANRIAETITLEKLPMWVK